MEAAFDKSVVCPVLIGRASQLVSFKHVLGQVCGGDGLIVEDLHWSDATSLELLLSLARRLRQQPLLLLLTYRADEVDPDLSAFLAELDRERLATELVLPRLNRSEVDQMVRAIFELDSPVRVDFLETIYSPAEGNPFFIEEILKSLLAAGEIFYADGRWDRKPTYQLSVPRSVREAVRQRQQQVSTAARGSASERQRQSRPFARPSSGS